MDKKTFDIILENYSLSDGDYEKKSWKRLAEELGFGSKDAIRKQFYREFAKQNTSGAGTIEDVTDQPLISGSITIGTATADHTTPYKESVEMKADGSVYSDKLVDIFSVDYKNPASLLQAHGFNPAEWVLVSAKNNLWGNKYQSKIAVKPKVDPKPTEVTFEDVDKFFKSFKAEVKREYLAPRNYSKDGKILEIDLADLHVGNVGVIDDGLSIEQKVEIIISGILEKVKHIALEKIILVNLGDILHYDTYKGTTTSGTQITTNMDLATIFDSGARILINAIDRLVEYAPVEVISIFGNHDRISSYMLMKAIEFYYHNSKNVSIDAGHLPRKFRAFGNCLVMWVHGDMSKENVYSLIQREARRDFGNTKFAEIHLGHFHSQSVIEKDGVILRYLPTITPTDAWHYDSGFSGAVRATVSFLWDKVSGLEEMWFLGV